MIVDELVLGRKLKELFFLILIYSLIKKLRLFIKEFGDFDNINKLK